MQRSKKKDQRRGSLHSDMVVGRKRAKPIRCHFGLGERTPRGTADLADEARRLSVRLGDPEWLPPTPVAGGLEPNTPLPPLRKAMLGFEIVI